MASFRDLNSVILFNGNNKRENIGHGDHAFCFVMIPKFHFKYYCSLICESAQNVIGVLKLWHAFLTDEHNEYSTVVHCPLKKGCFN